MDGGTKSYNSDYCDKLDDVIAQVKNSSEFTITIEGDFKLPPVLEIVKALDSPYLSVEIMDRLARFCILKTKISIFYDGDIVGNPIILNSIEDDWNVFDTFREMPMALTFLHNICAAFVIRKSTPPKKKAPPSDAATQETGQAERA